MTLATNIPSKSAFSQYPGRADPFLATQETDAISAEHVTRKPRVLRYGVIGFTATAFAFSMTTGMSETLRAADFSAVGEALGSHGHTTALASHFLDAYEEMQEFRRLADGWDGFGSITPSGNVIDAAIDFLRSLPPNAPPPEASASADGTVDWFWRSANGMVTVNFSRERRIAYYGKVNGQVAQYAQTFDGSSIPDDLLSVIKLI